MTYIYISTQEALDSLATTLTQEKPHNLSVDTEFVRKTTYWPKVCLVQLCFSGQTYIIDALSTIDLTPLKPCFDDKSVRKIFHSGRQDVEIFYRLWGTIPQNIADTQILGMVTGFGESVSYEKLCDAILRKKLDKSQQHTDWCKRPLSQRQLDYAADDVIDLEKVYEKLVKRAGKKTAYIEEELQWLASEETYRCDTETAWEKVRVRGPKKPLFWGRLKSLAAAREEVAIQTNTARGHVLKDDILIQLADMKEASLKQIKDSGIQSTSLAEKLSAAFDAGIPFEKEKPNKLNKAQDQLIDLIKVFLKATADDLHIAPKLFGTKCQITDFVLNPSTSPFLKGWRADLFGQTAKNLIEGKAALVFDPSKNGIITHEIDQS